MTAVQTAGVSDGSDAAAPSSAPPTGEGGRARAAAAFVKRPSVLTALAGLAGVTLTLITMPPPLYADSYWVFTAAERWPHLYHNFPGPLHHAMRLGTVLPTKIAQEIFGTGQTAWVVASCAFLAVLTAGTYAVGHALFRSWVGWAALGLLLLNPVTTLVDFYTRIVSNGSGGLLPDSPGAGWMCLGVAALVVGSRRDARKQLAWLASAGLCFGLAYLTREFAALMYVGIPAYWWLLRLPWRRIVAAAVPMVGCLAFELVHNAIVWHDPLARLTVAGEHHGQLAKGISPWSVLTGFTNAGHMHPLGWVFLGGLILTVAAALVTRDRRFWLLLVWFASLWIPLSLMGGLIDPTEPSLRVHLARYWFAIFPPLLIGGVAALDVFVKKLRPVNVRAAVAVLLAAVICLLYVAPAARELKTVKRDEDWRQLRAWLAVHDNEPVIYTDDRTIQTVGFYARSPSGTVLWHGTFKSVRTRVDNLPADKIGTAPYIQTKLGPKHQPSAADGWQVVFRSKNNVVIVWQR